MPAAGELRTRLELQSGTSTGNDLGEVTRTWSRVGHVWAKVEAAPARIGEQALVARIDVPVSITIRYRDDVTAESHRLVAGTTVYEIVSPPVDPDGRRRELRFLAVVRQHADTAAVVP